MRKLVALLAVVGGSLILAASATATEPAKGVNFNCGASNTILSEMSQAGSVWTRVDNVDWGGTQGLGNSLEWQGRNQWDQTYLNWLASCFTAIHNSGSNVLVVLGQGTPVWAAESGCTGGNCPPADNQYYEEAAAELAQQFPASNSTDGINAFEFWDEPNVTGHWAGNAQQYGQMEAAGYAGVKQYSTATTVFAATNHLNYNWISQALPYARFDVLGAHPYPTQAQTYWDNPAHYLSLAGDNNSLAGYQNLLCTYGPGATKAIRCSTPIWFTEAGFIVDAPYSPLSYSQTATGLTDQFHYLATSGCAGCSNVQQDDWYTSYLSPDPNHLALLGDPNFTPTYTPPSTTNGPYYALQAINPCYPTTCLLPSP